MIHAFQLLFIECNYPQAFVWWIGLHAVMFYFLFADFYKQAYLKKEKAKIAAEKRKADALSNGEPSGKTNGEPVKNGDAKPLENGHSKKNSEIKGKTANGRPFFNGFANICQMDHALLYEDDVPTTTTSTTSTNGTIRNRTNNIASSRKEGQLT